MPDTTTPVLGLTKPEIGASRDSWGAKWNTNADTLDQFVSMAMPIGAILDYAGPTAPSGWLVADGRTISRTTYSKLFAALGTAWGAGDGSTTFALPNLIGRSSVGPGTMTDQAGHAYTFGWATAQGFVTVTLAQANLPNYPMGSDAQGSHNHAGATTAAGSHAHSTDAQGSHAHAGAYLPDHAHTGYTDAQGVHVHNIRAARITGGNWVQGASGTQIGEVDYQTDAQGNHQHNIQTYGAGNIGLAIPADGYHAHNVYAVGDHQHGIYYDGTHAHTTWLGGSSSPFSVLSPIIVVTKIIYAGTQAALPLVTTDAVPAGVRLEDEQLDRLAVLEEELARLRAILVPARDHVQRTPARGLH